MAWSPQGWCNSAPGKDTGASKPQAPPPEDEQEHPAKMFSDPTDLQNSSARGIEHVQFVGFFPCFFSVSIVIFFSFLSQPISYFINFLKNLFKIFIFTVTFYPFVKFNFILVYI